ncbi:hypothetical protein HW115_07910 [Verrucomicrobiaceae bacterium N1E253]|uniref:DUF1570 domain-containing protein n=1 Tax=Oceaniferula marina TaxID=2748318 RepID=A0A851GF56_9BACT|nr:hypothetical protein [Oceaniferula marina]NWK55532.1 hypothetical protein [Oceaniferula marina]
MFRIPVVRTVLSLFTLASCLPLHADTFTLNNGKSFQGSLHKIQNKKVEVKLPDGRHGTVPLSAFSNQSQSNIKLWARQQGGNLDYASWIKCPDSAFSKAWPRTVYGPNTPSVQILQQESKPGHYAFASDHYRFVCDEKLDTQTVQKLATLFETTYLYNMQLPLNIPGQYKSKGHKFPIYLFGQYENYLRAGGPPGSAGAYLLRSQSIIVPLATVGVYKSGKKWKYLKSKQSSVLSHEITHQLMEGILLAPWFIEGSAEYIANTRYTHAAFHVYGSKRHIFDCVISKKVSKSHTSRKLGPRVSMPPLKTFMNQSYQQFASGRQVNRNYGMALLLTYYFYHGDGSPQAHNIKNYVKAIQRGKSEKEAQKALLNGRSYESVQKSFASYCAANGLTVEFK